MCEGRARGDVGAGATTTPTNHDRSAPGHAAMLNVVVGQLLLHVLLALHLLHAVAVVGAAPPAPPRKYEIPPLPWPGEKLPRDWVSVKAVGGAKGDGTTDDTEAIQATIDLYTTCKDRRMNASATGRLLGAHTCGGTSHSSSGSMTPCSTVFFPAGTYRISSPLYVGHCNGLVMLGTGATTTIEWAGAPEGTMMISNGTVFGRWEGFVWDGRFSAKWGISYNSTHGSLFETRELHRNSRFSNFLDAGISVGVTSDNDRKMGKKETAEALVQNCIFENNFKGIALQDFNDYDWAIDGCTFTNNSYGVYSHTHMDSNFDAHSCRFEESRMADLTVSAEASNVRQVVSVGSYQFVATLGGGLYHSPLQIHDCRVANWTGPSAISFDLRGPLTITNNEFFSSSTQRNNNNVTLVAMDQGGSPAYKAVLLEGGNLLDSEPVNAHADDKLFVSRLCFGHGNCSSPGNVIVESIAGATQTSSDVLTINTQFDRKQWPVPMTVFDCTTAPYSANASATCVEQQAAIQACIDAAAKRGHETMAYLPAGDWQICKPIEIPSGADFFFRGAGYATSITLGHPSPPPGPHPGPHPPPGPPRPHPPPPPSHRTCKRPPPKTSIDFDVITNGSCPTYGLFDINSAELCRTAVLAIGFNASHLESSERFVDGCSIESSCELFQFCPPGNCQHQGPALENCAVICAKTKPPPAPPGPAPGPPHPPPPHPPPTPAPTVRCDPTVMPPEKCPGDQKCPNCGTKSCTCPPASRWQNGAPSNSLTTSTAASTTAGTTTSPTFDVLPAHIVIGIVQNFRLDGFMFKSQRNYNQTTAVLTVEDTCSVRVQPQSRAGSSELVSGLALDLYADWLFYDKAYNGSACGVQLLGLRAQDVVRVGYLDMGLDVADSAEASVLVDFMTGGRLQLRGNEGKARAGFFGVKMFCGLAIDYDVIVTGSQDLVIGYLYAESLSHHIKLQASPFESTQAAASMPGNVAIRGVKIHAYQGISKDPSIKRNTSIWLESTGWIGSLLYSNSQAEYCDGCLHVNKGAPSSAQAKACKCYEVTQTGSGAFNLSLIGNSWWAIGGGAQSDDFSEPNGVGPVFTGMAPEKQVVMLGGIVDNWGAANPWEAGNVTVPDIRPTGVADQDWRISTGLNLFTMLGKVDLALNYPGQSPLEHGAQEHPQ